MTITPLRALNIREVCGRMDDLLVSADDIKELAKNERENAIDEFAEALRKECLKSPYKEVWLHTMLKIANELKGE